MGIINSISLRDKLYHRFRKAKPNIPEHITLKTNLTTYNKIHKKNIRAAKSAYYEACFE